MKYEATIGLEVHVQLNTKSKMFCGCSTEYGAPPNTHVCQVCLGYPGTLPVMNSEAIRRTVMTGLMIGSTISEYSKFDRKSYFYPDMPKNYQISQYDKPLCIGGNVDIVVAGREKKVGVTRIHLEEDVAKNTHLHSFSGIDFNRAGIPLMEIVSEPAMTSPEEAFAYLQALKKILQYAGVSDCNLEQGNVRCDVNCSIRPEGGRLGTKIEIKNLNTFKGVLHALEHEISRQTQVIESGGKIEQETRRWDMDTGATYVMRTKEYAHDYRYFPEPDLMPVVLDKALVEKWRSQLPELPADRKVRFVREYGLPEYDAGVLVADKAVADYFEAAARRSRNSKAVSNWMMTEMLRLLSEREMEIGSIPMKPESLAELVELADAKTVNSNTAREIFAEMFEKGGSPAAMVKEKGLSQVSDGETIAKYVEQAISENRKSASDFRSGKTAALKFLVGQVMRLSKGKANPQMAARLIQEKLRFQG